MIYNVKIEDVRSEYLDIIEIIGLDPFLQLVQAYGGMQLYIPKEESLQRNARDEEIRANFTGHNFTELAKRYKLTERYVREIVSPILKEVRNRPMAGQVTLFDADD